MDARVRESDLGARCWVPTKMSDARDDASNDELCEDRHVERVPPNELQARDASVFLEDDLRRVVEEAKKARSELGDLAQRHRGREDEVEETEHSELNVLRSEEGERRGV